MTELENKKRKESLLSMVTYHNIILAISFIFLLIGILFYVSWSILYNTWGDPGLYSFCLPMAVFGLIGIAYSKVN
ncbi:MAG: hypothetical protein M1375_01005 [Candidatus Thermoplasmatota archaeon]|jgi:fatty acid desaturase|nr:hypothetical protein [Candidatus Thermoplasmatota archaeon]MCL5790537.1 hypothetical protein [Candidatus Thermoplasmatota archaeon]